MTALPRPDEQLRHGLDGRVKARLGDRRQRLQVFREPAGDPGWFGPDSMTWRVHARLGPMLVGGLSALLLQTLHPLVVQGVADHSNYREDPFGRLQRTADFIALTTYGSCDVAEEAVRTVRAVHATVHGHTAGGERYSANSPDLLTYVHVTEVWSFLRAYQRYSQHPLLLSEKNCYLAETSTVAVRLGARDVPDSVDAVRAYLRRVRPQLRRGPEAERIVRFLRHPPRGASALERTTYLAIVEAGIDLMPAFARMELGLLRPAGLRLTAVRPAAALLSQMLHWSVGEAPQLAAARARVGATR